MARPNRSGIDWNDPVARQAYRQAHGHNRPPYVTGEHGIGNSSHLTAEQQEALLSDVLRMSLTEAARKHGVTRTTAVAYRKLARGLSD